MCPADDSSCTIAPEFERHPSGFLSHHRSSCPGRAGELPRVLDRLMKLFFIVAKRNQNGGLV
jgi:hypothetical protein